MIDDIWQNKLDHQEATLVRQNRPAVTENFDCRPIFISVKHMFQHVNAGSGRDFVA